MKLVRGFCNIQPCHQNCVVTIGNFDGVHLGHQKILKRLKQKSRQLGLPAVIITFEPLPEEFLRKSQIPESMVAISRAKMMDESSKIPARLMNLSEKYLRFKSFEVDYILVLRFDEHFAALTPDEFIQKILITGLKCRYLIVGEDFCFGKKRSGDVNYLTEKATQFNFDVEVISPFLLDFHSRENDNLQSYRSLSFQISSTLVRHLLKEGNLDFAKQLLGQTYQLIGKVIHGDGRGSALGFPTANIDLKRFISPLSGTYAVRVKGLDRIYFGIANVGYRPTFHRYSKAILEVNIFDFNRDIYGKRLCVEFLQKIRDEKKFKTQEMLKKQIRKDTEIVRKFFSF